MSGLSTAGANASSGRLVSWATVGAVNNVLPLVTGAARHHDLRTLMGERSLRAALTSGVLCQPWRGVVVRSEEALDLRTRASAAILAIGDHAVLSGPTAVALHGCAAAGTHPIHVTVPYSRSARNRTGLVVHQNRFREEDVVRVGELPVFAQDLALTEFLCDGDKWQAFASLDEVLHGLDEASIAAMKHSIRTRLEERDDPRGVARAAMLTELATGRAESPPESIWRLIVVEAGLPIPEPQYEVRSIDGAVIYLLDMGWESVRVALEHDGYAAHEARADYDAERDRRLAQRGWIVVRARAADLKDPSRVLAELRAAFARRT